MPRLRDLWADDPVTALMHAHYPQLSIFSPENAEFKQLSQRDQAAIHQTARAFREKLEALAEDELQPYIEEGKALGLALAQKRKENSDAQLFYNQPSAAIDLDFWSRIAFWTLDEAVALSLGKDPRRVNWDNIKSHVKVSDFAAEYEARRTLVTRAKIAGQLWDSTQTGIFLAWAERTRFPMPTELITAVKDFGVQIGDWKTLFDRLKEQTDKMFGDQRAIIEGLQREIDTHKGQQLSIPAIQPAEKPLGTRERESLLKLVIGLAISCYTEKEVRNRSTVASEISGDLQRLGIPLSDDTIRKYLGEAREFLPPPQTEQKR